MTTENSVEPSNEKAVAENNTLSEKPTPPAVKKTSSKTSLWLALLSLCVAGAAIAGCVYMWQQSASQQELLKQSRIDINAALQRLDAQLDEYRRLQRQLDQQEDTTKRQLAESTAKIESLQQQLASQQKRLLSLSTTDRDDWLLAEAEYLMRLANQRLLMGKEIKGAASLLEAADEIIHELDDAALYPVRKALAVDREALRVAGQLDIEGLYLKLGAIAQQASKLELVAMPELTMQPTETTEPENWQQRFQWGLDEAMHKVSQYIQINRRDEIYKPLLSPEYEAVAQQNIQLMFEQAQMAVLSGKQKLFDDSLEKSKQWLQRYYTLDQVATDKILSAIDEVADKKITVELPDISASLRALKDYQQIIHPVPSAQAKKSETSEQEAAQ